ncbi:hypothetical protein ARMSODRAFT_1021777 [Armillaria solidipes]|uniref:Uncharacterized protein n=1 Tax=Armillaria solidipes TaxID=1076256 RepID=A0A2H3B5N4_9AGAR|nr:hypothetical protein ARMSODRAFT_1021777 [Armillaria solidipes]
MDNPIQPAPTQNLDLASMQSALAHLHKITDAGDGCEANTFMQAVINNLWAIIGTPPSALGERISGIQHQVYEACHSHMRHTDIIVYKSYSVETANDALIKQVVLFLDLNWFGWMTPFMCAEYTRIRDINNFRKVHAFERAYEAEVGELGPESMYSAVLMPVLKITSSGSIVSDWEACPNGGMADEWESEDEEEEEGMFAVDLQAGHNFYSPELGELGYPQE